MKKILPSDLIPMDIFVGSEPIKIDLVYADGNHPRNIFEKDLYQKTARFWTHKDLAAVTLIVARNLSKKYGYTLELQDSLRTMEAQESMQDTNIVRAHPEWMEEPDRLLSPPGAGAHPRAMAIDVAPLNKDGNKVDMGTPFDHMDIQSHRTYKNFSDEILDNRKILESSFVNAGKLIGREILPIASEWWDFRFYPDDTAQYKPLSDRDLPPQMQLTGHFENNIPDFDQEHFDKLAQEIITIVDANI